LEVLVCASSSSSSPVIDSNISLDAPNKSSGDVSPRFADRAAPAARCCAFEAAGIFGLLSDISGANAPLRCWFPSEGTNWRTQRYRCIETGEKGAVMRGVLLWLIGIPIPVIILLYVFKAM
jgi:hypothetical protein